MFKSVVFYTNHLKSLRRFYMNTLELTITEATDEYFTIRMGESLVTFKQHNKPAFYHFAINIPGNQFSLMKHWIKERIPLNREGGRDEVYFENFDADSMYFHDPAGNIVELIGRRKRDLLGELSSDAFLNISEVGIVTPYVTEVGERLQDAGIPLWRSLEVKEDEINFLGKNETFFVLVPEGRRWYFSNQISKVFPMEVTLSDGTHITVCADGKLTIEINIK